MGKLKDQMKKIARKLKKRKGFRPLKNRLKPQRNIKAAMRRSRGV